MINIQALHNLVAKNVPFHNLLAEKEWWKIRNAGGNIFGTEWEPISSLAEIPYTIFADSLGHIYVTTNTKIYRSTDNGINFSEMTLTGTVKSPFGNVTEGPSGRLYCIDNSTHPTPFGSYGAVWTKESAASAFVRRSDWQTFEKYWATRTWISAHPDSNVIIYSENEWYGAGSNRLVAANATTGARLHTFVISDIGLTNIYPLPAKRQSDNSWLIGCPGASGYSVVRYVEGSGFTRVLLGATTINSTNVIDIEENDRVILVGNKSSTTGFFRTSSDFGLTWTAETIFSISSVINDVVSLAPECLIATLLTNKIIRSLNDLATAPLININTQFNDIIRMPTGVLFAVANTNAGPNIYRSTK